MKVHEVNVNPALPERIAWLGEIARNVWSAWSPEAGDLFARLDPEAWERLEHNPVALLRTLPQDTLDAAADDESFVAMVARVARRLDAYVNEPGWLLATDDDAKDMLVAYFSLEFGLDAGDPALLRRPRHPGRRPPEVGVGHRRAARRRGPAVPQRLLPPAARPRRRPARALPRHELVGPPALRPDRRGRRARRSSRCRWATTW